MVEGAKMRETVFALIALLCLSFAFSCGSDSKEEDVSTTPDVVQDVSDRTDVTAETTQP